MRTLNGKCWIEWLCGNPDAARKDWGRDLSKKQSEEYNDELSVVYPPVRSVESKSGSCIV